MIITTGGIAGRSLVAAELSYRPVTRLGEWSAGAVTDLAGLLAALAFAYGVVLGVVALVTVWQALSARRPPKRRRGVVVPPVGAIAPDVNHGGQGRQGGR